jgi:hypothetical protein
MRFGIIDKAYGDGAELTEMEINSRNSMASE